MKKEILLNIAIPTYNRASCVEKLLNNIMPQVKEAPEAVEVCISDNGSADNTKEIVEKFKNKYPGFIKYSRNEKNLGVDVNIIKVLEMSEGSFTWLFGDDDVMAKNALNEVINFILKNQEEKIGLIFVKTESYYFDKKTNQKVIWSNKIDKSKPDVFEINKKDIISVSFPEIVFITALILNNKLVKKILKEDAEIVEKAVGTLHVHAVIFCLMFLKYPDIKGIALNKQPLIYQELSRYKFFIEDKFRWHYYVQKKLINLLLSLPDMDSKYALIFIKKDKKLKWAFVTDMLVLKAFKSFNYFSFFGCIKLFFENALFIDAVLFSITFLIINIIPSAVLVFSYKLLLFARHGKNWKQKWQLLVGMVEITFRGTRRRYSLPTDK